MNCEDAEMIPKEYPYVVMESVSTSNSGAKFSANVSGLGNQTILSHGFVWGVQSTLNIEVDDHKYITSKPATGSIVMEINSGLMEGQTYYVRPFIQTENILVYGSELSFTSEGSNPPEIHDFQPKFGPVGTRVEITGKNFGLSGKSNTVKFGEYIAQVDSATETKLYVKVPQVKEPEEVNIIVETAGMLVNSNEKFDLYFPWLRLSTTHSINYGSTSFTIADKAYIINSNTSSGLRFNSSDETWQAFSLPENAGPYPKAFSISNKGYAVLENGFYEYDPVNNIWTQKANFPDKIERDDYTFTMSFDQSGFIGFCYKNQKLWSYNPKEDIWTERASFPEDFTQTSFPVWGSFSFSIENKGYLGVSQSTSVINTFWEYDVNSDSWMKKFPLPSDAHGNFASMVVKGEAYVGLGQKFTGCTCDNTSNQVWKYNQSSDNWEAYQNNPITIGAYASFGLGEKGYVIAGYTKNYDVLNEIWEFDPKEN